jgi:hypothetical protein
MSEPYEHLPYEYLPYPYPHVPAPGEPVSHVVIAEAILPLVQSVQCTLAAFSNAAEHDELLNDHLALTLSMLAEQLELAIGLLEHLGEGGEEDKDEG